MIMNSSDYRRIARENLQGNWGPAVLAAFVAAILGGLIIRGGLEFNIELDEDYVHTSYQFAAVAMRYIAGVGATLNLVHFILGGVIRQGYALYLLKQHDRREPQLNDLFSQFHRFGDGFCLAFLEGLYIFLWSLLLIIPGIVASYRYAMAPFILQENPDMTASEAIEASKQMMDGHKGELFTLHLTFIGWEILCLFTAGIGLLWLNPYMNAAEAAFYRDLKRRPIVE